MGSMSNLLHGLAKRNGMEWNKWLGLSASLLAGGTAGSPQLLPGPGQRPPTVCQNPEALDGIQQEPYFPITGWRASPVFGYK